MNRAKYRDYWWKLAPERSGPQTGAKVHLPIGLRPISTQPRQSRSGFGTSLWMSLSGPAEPGLEPDWTSHERPETSCAATLPIQPDRAWEDLQRKIGETPQVQVCQTCSIIPKNTRGCNRWQRCFNRVLNKVSEYLGKCYIYFIHLQKITTFFALSLWGVVCRLMRYTNYLINLRIRL